MPLWRVHVMRILFIAHYSLHIELPFAYFISGNTFLASTFKPSFRKNSFSCVLGRTPLNPFSPHAPTFRFHFLPHQFNHIFFGYSKLKFDGIERGAVFPSHLHDAVYVPFCQIIFFLNFHVGINNKIRVLFFEKSSQIFKPSGRWVN